MDLQTVINLNNSENAADYSSSGSVGMQKGVAHLLKVYMMHAMTDTWGAVPYSEALQGVDNLKPVLTINLLYTQVCLQKLMLH